MSARRLAIGLVTAAAAVLTLPAVAAAEPRPLVSFGSDLTAPAGVVRTPDGSVWVADPIRGICRVATEGLVSSDYCGEAEGDHAGPDEPSGLAFDAATATLVTSDGASSGGAIWRLKWSEADGIESGTRFAAAALADDRVTAMTLGPSPAALGTPADVYFVTKRSAAVRRLSGTSSQPDIVGFAQRPDSPGIARFGDDLYIAGSGVTRLGLRPDDPAIASPLPGVDASNAAALAVDAERRRLYIGTSSADLRDRVDVLDVETGELETYARGFTGITALGVEGNGDLLVGDDPAAATGALDSAGQGRLWRVDLGPLHRPLASITDGPATATNSTSATFAYTSRSSATFECRLDDSSFTACPGTGAGSISFDDLDEGVHRFAVRAVDDEGTGLPALHTFVVDTTAPRVLVLRPRDPFVDGGAAPRLDFSADEDHVVFSCSVDEGPFRPCEPRDALVGLAVGEHALDVVAVDPAGNTSEPDGATFTIVEAEVEPEPEPEPRPKPKPKPESRPESPEPYEGKATQQRHRDGGVNRAPDATPAADRVIRRVRLRPARVRVSGGRRPRRLRVTFDAPRGATGVGLVLVDARGRAVLRRSARVRAAASNRVTVRLGRMERRRLRRGVYLMTAVIRVESSGARDGKRQRLRVQAR
jgi:hypothetical protein